MIRKDLLKIILEDLEHSYNVMLEDEDIEISCIDDYVEMIEDWENVYDEVFVEINELNEREIEFLEYNWEYMIMMFCNYMKLKEVNMWYYN